MLGYESVWVVLVPVQGTELISRAGVTPPGFAIAASSIGRGCIPSQRLYGSIGEPRQDVAKIPADRQVKTPAALHQRED
jgi:hypothetical protein